MITNDDIPQSWLAVLEKVQSLCPEAVLAGGALRDLSFGFPAKDLDVFVSARNVDDFRRIVAEMKETLGTITMNYAPDESYRIWNEEVIGVATFESPLSDHPVQVIGIDYAANPDFGSRVLDRIDLGICQIATNGEDVSATSWFRNDCWNQSMTLTRIPDNGHELVRTVERFLRLKEKYKGWTFSLGNHLIVEQSLPLAPFDVITQQ